MRGPRDIIRQAVGRRAQSDRTQQQRVPAPAPIPVRQPDHAAGPAVKPNPQILQRRMPPLMQTQDLPPVRETGPDREKTGATVMAVPKNIGGHAVYRELMRSHDRMGTRHIGPRG